MICDGIGWDRLGSDGIVWDGLRRDGMDGTI